METESNESKPELTKPETLPDKLVIYFDGACEPRNPGGWATYGWVIMTHEGQELQTGKGVAAPEGHANATNNYAEWCALGFALRWLADRQWQGELSIYGDSNLVIQQLASRWNCNAEKLKKLRARCWELIAAMGNKFTSTWVPRDRNERCDGLSKEAFVDATGKPFPERRRPAKEKSLFQEMMEPAMGLPGDVDAQEPKKPKRKRK